MAFKIFKSYSPPMLEERIIDNSDTVRVGDAVQLRNGDLEVHTAGAAVAGVVVDIVDRNGNSISGSIAIVGSATVSGAAGAETVTVASDNETVDMIKARIDTSKQTIYSALITGTMNTTTSSNKPGGWVNASDARTIDETTHSRTITNVRTWKNHGVDPNDSTRMLVSINHSELWDFSGTAMA